MNGKGFFEEESMSEKVAFRDECLECQHFASDTWTAPSKPIVSYCFGFGERREVHMDEKTDEPCSASEPRGGGNRY
jgi:hypothetical protein